MADYWVSQEKKFCDVCKCWMAGNKISIGIHENGNRHKEAVQKHLHDMTKKSNQIVKKEKAVNDAIRKMNEGALNCMIKDLASDPNAAQQYGVKLTENAMQEIQQKVAQETNPKNSISSNNKPISISDIKSGIGEWLEAKTEDGHTYYWNNVSLETSWFRPEPIVLLDKVDEEKQDAKNQISSFINDKLEELGTKREDIVEDETKPCETYPESYFKNDPYGSWKTVKPVKLPKLDLPKAPKRVEIRPQIAVPDDDPVLQVSEKTAPKRTATSNSSRIVFKKRKQNSAANLRQKTDDDE